jgi:hypothetical protein
MPINDKKGQMLLYAKLSVPRLQLGYIYLMVGDRDGHPSAVTAEVGLDFARVLWLRHSILLLLLGQFPPEWQESHWLC